MRVGQNKFLMLLFYIIFYMVPVHAKTILTCPKDLLLLTNNQITSADRHWVFDNTYSGSTNEDFVTKTKREIALNKLIPIKNKIYADLFSVTLRTQGATCIYMEKKTKRLLYLDTVTIYKPYNTNNWNKWNNVFNCGNVFPENGKVFPLDYCQFIESQ